MSTVGLLASSQTTLLSPGVIVPRVPPPASPAIFTRVPCGYDAKKFLLYRPPSFLQRHCRPSTPLGCMPSPTPLLCQPHPRPTPHHPPNPICKAQCFIHSQKVARMLRCRLNVLRWLTWPGARVPLERVTLSASANHRSSMAAPKAKQLRMPGAGDEAEHIMSTGRVGKKGGRGGGR